MAWATLAEEALADRAVDDVTAYAYARVGYHRSLDLLRRNGWKGHGPVPWEHEPNQGFLRALAALAGEGPFPVIGFGLRLPLRDSVMLNGTLIHGLDYDDTHSDAVVHASASAVPTALGMARRHGASGREALLAMAARLAGARVLFGAEIRQLCDELLGPDWATRSSLT